ncbi:MAG TPA: hypothetical protein VLW85_12835 [Myxococcales bacterium]|nr:hypothetical protein [Myxococcales bacterium]
MRSLAVLALLSCAHAPVGPEGMGLSKERAIEVCLPPGEKAYMASLHCPDGSRPQPRRIGSVGARHQPVDPDDARILLQMDPERPLQPGEPDLHIVDAIEARCGKGSTTIFFDMYHCPAPPQPAPEGFTRDQ